MSMLDRQEEPQPPPRRQESAEVRLARAILNQKCRYDDLPGLADRLQKQRAFRYARRIMALARQSPDLSPEQRVTLAQKHALYTYKDIELPPAVGLDRALEILTSEQDLAHSTQPETLGLAGAIYKRKWEVDGQQRHLKRALLSYRRGYQISFSHYDAYLRDPASAPDFDHGYTGINAAYMLDVLASLDEDDAQQVGLSSAPTAEAYRREATDIRRRLTTDLLKLPDLDELQTRWWFVTTLTEAYFGLQDYERAREWLQRCKAVIKDQQIEDWKIETTVRQLAALVRLQQGTALNAKQLVELPAGKLLSEFLGNRAAGVFSSFVGKVGLALSGGGFRASLFHLGVLARLAEMDMLRHVEVLSCVSGGSIVGTHYYLKVKELLWHKQDLEVTQADYIELVHHLIDDFLAGVQENIRMQVAKDVKSNFKMIYSPNYSRTERAGELFEEKLFLRGVPLAKQKPLWLSDLPIQPIDESEDFSPKNDNWRRAAKVPILVLNATTLNTGHNWQFTATWMGESPYSIDPDIDANARLRRMYHWQAPGKYKDKGIRLGHAVAASACVPGLFDPLALPDLYPHMTIQLVDGGVHDNQGNVSLLEQHCSVMLVSDASGQSETQADPKTGIYRVLKRSNDILMARVREAQYHDLANRRRTTLVRGLMYVHLKQDLYADPVNWIGCDDPAELPATTNNSHLTRYGISKAVQRRLAAIRTDLDSFTHIEAYALMTSGYRMTEEEFLRDMPGFPLGSTVKHSWPFLCIEPHLKGKHPPQQLSQVLDVATSRFFKSWRLRWAQMKHRFGRLPGLHNNQSAPQPSGANGSAADAANPKPRLRLRKTIQQVAIGFGMASVGWLAARFQLRFLDPEYLNLGKTDRLDQDQR